MQINTQGENVNVFSLPTPDGGNYWSDWTTPDTNGDGFVDNAYVFFSGQDGLPLTRPTDSISGTVTDDAGAPLENFPVYVQNTGLAGFGGNRVQTDAGGVYTISGLLSGNYKVLFNDPSWGLSGANSVYVPEYYDNKRDWDTADTVAVIVGAQTDGIDASLERGGSITGTVTNGAGVPLENVYVDASDGSQLGSRYAFTDAAGKYTR